MSEQRAQDDCSPTTGVYCLVTNGGSQDGRIVYMNRRYDVLTYITKVMVPTKDPTGYQERLHSTTYEYCWISRTCPQRGKIHLYSFTSIELSDLDDYRPYCEDAENERELKIEDLLGMHGFVEGFDA